MVLLRVVLSLWLLAFPAYASTPRVTQVIDGDTVVLDDNRQVRLYGIQAPKLSLGRTHVTDWPLAHEAKAALAEICLNQTVTLRLAPNPQDRHGRVLAELVLDDGQSTQQKMISLGMARVYTLSDNAAIATALYPLEEQARLAKKGIWANDYYKIRTPENVGTLMDNFAVVEGRVQNVATIKGATYINFGTDWKKDFTIISTAALGRDINVASLVGKNIRVRGWVHSKNGAAISLTHAEQLERID